MDATCPDDFKLESVLCRLRAGARALFGARGGASPALRARHPDLADYDDAFRELREKAASELRRVGYSEEAFQQDRLALEAALLAAARTCGEIALERIDDIADDFRTIYLSGPDAHANIGDLILTIRNWLPFISFSPYIELYDHLPPVPEVSEVEPLPQMSMADGPPVAPDPPAIAAPGGAPSEADLHAVANQGGRVGIMQALRATSYMPWRTPGKNAEPTDPRRQVLDEEGESDQDLRARLYLDHPILLVVQYLSPLAVHKHPVPPRALQAMLVLPVNERELAFRHVVELCIQHLREAGDKLRSELTSDDVDWSRLRPLLAWGAEVIAKDEPHPSVVREILDDIISKMARPRWTERDTLAAAAVIVAVVMAVASFGVGGVAGFVLMTADIAVQTAAVHAHELLTERENAERERLNRVAAVDAALTIASDPEVSQLGWWLGLVSLALLPITAATAGARFLRGRALGRAREAAARTLTAARQASMEVTLTRFRVPPEPLVPAPHVAPDTPPVGGPRPAAEPPAAPRDSGVPSRPPDGGKQSAPRSDLFDDDLAADDAFDPAPAKKPAPAPSRAIDTAARDARAQQRLKERIAASSAQSKAEDAAARDARAQQRLKERIAASLAQSKAEDAAAAARATQSRSVQRPNTGRPISSAETETAATSVAPKRGWKIRRVELQQLYPQGRATPGEGVYLIPGEVVEVVENGVVMHRAWLRPDFENEGRVVTVVESYVGKRVRRHRHNVPTVGEMQPEFIERYPNSEVAHPHGPGQGFDSTFGLGRGPGNMGLADSHGRPFQSDVLNQLIEATGIERTMAQLRNRSVGTRERFRRITETSRHPDSLRIRSRRHTVIREVAGQEPEVFFSIRVNLDTPSGGEAYYLSETGKRIFIDDIEVSSALWADELLSTVELPVFSNTPLQDRHSWFSRARRR